MQPVEAVLLGPGKTGTVRVRYCSGEYEGLLDWVPRGRLLCIWDEADGLLLDERRLLAAVAASTEPSDSPLHEAVDKVLGVASDLTRSDVMLGAGRIEQNLLVISPFRVIPAALGLDEQGLLSEPGAFVDRQGVYRAPFASAERLAKLLCQRFPRDVLADIRRDEDHHRWVVTHPENARECVYAEKALARSAIVNALVYAWCGADACSRFDEIAALREEVDRLRVVLESTATWLRAEGHSVKASLLLKGLEPQDSVHSGRPNPLAIRLRIPRPRSQR